MDNLRAALVWSLENNEVTMALEIASFLQSIWLGQGRIREGLAWIDAALAADGTREADSAAARVRALADKALLDSWYGSLDVPDLGCYPRRLDDRPRKR